MNAPRSRRVECEDGSNARSLSRDYAIARRTTVGSTGVPPVPAGVPPGGANGRTESPFGECHPLGQRLGGTPSRTGGTPVLPIVATRQLNSYGSGHYVEDCSPSAGSRPKWLRFPSPL